MKTYKHFIAGQYQGGDQSFEINNPATGERIGLAARGAKFEIDQAVEVARETFRRTPWADMDGRLRGDLLRKVARTIRSHSKEIAALEVVDAGKTIGDARADVEIAAQTWDYYADLTQSAVGTVNAVPSPDQFDYTIRQPMGAIGIIIPWNFPFMLTALKLAPALAAGNTVVLKPSEETPVTASFLGQLLNEAGIPPGVVNIVLGMGEEAGVALAAHAGIEKLIFTGSTEVGSLVMQAAARNLTDVTLELGGKSANIICADADREQAIMSAAFGCLLHSGQCCSAGTRLLIEGKIYDSFMDQLRERFERVRVGNPADSKTHLGPLISDKQLRRVEDYVDIGKSEGATLVTGGSRPAGTALGKGFYFQPTLLGDARNGMRIAQEEIFGPVLTCIRFEDFDQAIDMANDSTYGLAAGVCTRDLVKAHHAARRLQAGTVWINTFNGTALNTPFLGWKRSGIGVECGVEGLNDNMHLKHVRLDLSGKPLPVFEL